ncbi:hypothetical protein BOTCAL_0053g00240 [Botryotinia calthae]|uniref:Uncharacterized protein n=1 Tax=Botryotinia calthae TaxID=38488 RepID=A0A4Y8DAP7_9HELO|nr:hypothetical protein BOTCAL_0053g00240 [Botryotinia calthae]
MSKRMYNTTILKELLQRATTVSLSIYPARIKRLASQSGVSKSLHSDNKVFRPSHNKRLPKNMGSTIMDHSRSDLSGEFYDKSLAGGHSISTLFFAAVNGIE